MSIFALAEIIQNKKKISIDRGFSQLFKKKKKKKKKKKFISIVPVVFCQEIKKSRRF